MNKGTVGAVSSALRQYTSLLLTVLLRYYKYHFSQHTFPLCVICRYICSLYL